MARAYYNEIDKHAAQWLRNLIDAGHIPPGDVDERSITDITPGDLDGYTQCHFFAGIGGWPYALRLAGWPDERPIATGSCPCQPFSSAGQGRGTDDERHLWPAFRWLVKERRFPVVAGEQVASADGREWLTGVRDDLERMGYDVGAADLCAAGVGAPHIRQRLFWMAYAEHLPARPGGSDQQGQPTQDGRSRPADSGARRAGLADADIEPRQRAAGSDNTGQERRHNSGSSQSDGGLGHALDAGPQGHAEHGDDGREPGRDRAHEDGPAAQAGIDAGGLADNDSEQRRQARTEGGNGSSAGSGGNDSGLEHAECDRREQERCGESGSDRETLHGQQTDQLGNSKPWYDFTLVRCVEPTKEPGRFMEKWRRAEPGTCPLAHGVPGRVGRLRAYGNAIVPQLAAKFIIAAELAREAQT